MPPPRLRVLGVLTSGGDAPGMNAAIRAVVRTAIGRGVLVVGIERGFSGLIMEKFVPLERRSVANIIQRGGTMLLTSRCPEFHERKVRARAADLLKRAGIGALVVIGGDGSFRGAHLLEQETGVRVAGIPGTIDNDLNGTGTTIGFDTAVNTALEAIDRIRDTAASHERVFFIEVMGRAAGYIALQVGLAGGAEAILVPEIPVSIRSVAASIRRGQDVGKRSSLIVVAEGEEPGRSFRIARELLRMTGEESRVVVLGHIQRGGTPTAADRVLASRLGSAAVEHLLKGESDFMVGVAQGEVRAVPLPSTWRGRKPFDRRLYDLAGILAQ